MCIVMACFTCVNDIPQMYLPKLPAFRHRGGSHSQTSTVTTHCERQNYGKRTAIANSRPSIDHLLKCLAWTLTNSGSSIIPSRLSTFSSSTWPGYSSPLLTENTLNRQGQVTRWSCSPMPRRKACSTRLCCKPKVAPSSISRSAGKDSARREHSIPLPSGLGSQNVYNKNGTFSANSKNSKRRGPFHKKHSIASAADRPVVTFFENIQCAMVVFSKSDCERDKRSFDRTNFCKTKHASSGDDTLIHDENRVARLSMPMKVESIYTDGTRIRLISKDTDS